MCKNKAVKILLCQWLFTVDKRQLTDYNCHLSTFLLQFIGILRYPKN